MESKKNVGKLFRILQKLKEINFILGQYANARQISLEEYGKICDKLVCVENERGKILGISLIESPKISVIPSVYLAIDKRYLCLSIISALLKATLKKIASEISADEIILNVLINENSNENNWAQIMEAVGDLFPNKFKLVSVCKLKI